MVFWWPFQRGGQAAPSGGAPPSSFSDEGGEAKVPRSQSLLDIESFNDMAMRSDRRFGDNSSPYSQLDRMRDEQKIRRHGDGRALSMDVESVDMLVNRYEEEFREADAHMKARKAQRSLLQRYDYANDRRYQQWAREQKEVQEKLKIHWLDWMIDQPSYCLVYFLRVCTSAGFCFGAGRTAYLYRTMDKTYAKLNGVTLGSVAFQEITTSVAKSGAIALMGTIGMPVGDALMSLCMMLSTGDVSSPQRTWWHILNSGLCAGFLGGVAYVGLNYKQLTSWGVRALLLLSSGSGAAAGLYLGYFVYRPYAAQRIHALYDPYWRPWHIRHERNVGPANVRGRYL
ncbi:hypothetical protein LSCM1_01131 [Leishmania martiniquensis]|uniref:Transmembrane protein n=1 Tax=Leishmania martiniquensis TaxID=1580590 RepID=A0A836GN90_9TRYP|nr:hypothetical protein LSCM1_01131 [Leishmania martiniquensis]